ncbi:DUF6221 family protein [Streptomyces sp. 5.8]|uniref:DUF6221 family protein n=1 Tax=Streptomyces sp. 5.8 TaxID=3406571 RepID=UPI003BB789BE
MDDPVQFLRARLDEDEQTARAASAGWYGYDPEQAIAFVPVEDTQHIARHDPARVLAEVAAKRRRLARHTPERRRLALNDQTGTTSFAYLICTSCTPNRDIDTERQALVEWPCPDLLDDAAVYAGHPDYQAAWSLKTPAS